VTSDTRRKRAKVENVFIVVVVFSKAKGMRMLESKNIKLS
jgi:hypothetical protein